jgi:hypothetical protein
VSILKVIEIGFGPHAKRIYFPALQELGKEFNVSLSLVVDLKQQEFDIRDFFSDYADKPDFLFVDPFEGNLPKEVDDFLNNYVAKHKIDGVIISTEPLCHYAYAKWALKVGLNILMDKPITTKKEVVTDLSAAKKIESDYMELLKDYLNLQEQKETVFIINTQRRFHPGFNLVNKLLSEIAVKTNCPITAIQSSHCDGQWRLPNEIVTQQYHPYCSGYGKGSHSGYHIFDSVYQFYKVSKLTAKIADSMEIFSSFFQPKGFLFQLNQNDYEKYFGKAYSTVRKYSDNRLYKMFSGYGEMDLSAIVRLKRGEDCIGNIAINLMHNGFARRSWVKPGKDLYKGNGRVKHEYHNIEQGPFQNIQIHSYQSKDKHDTNTKDDYLLGGNSHFDIYVFRNKDITGDKDPLKIFRMSDLKKYCPEVQDDKLAIESVKHRVVKEFLSCLVGKRSKIELTSNIDDHLMPVQIMSGIYRSHNNYIRGLNPLVRYNLTL